MPEVQETATSVADPPKKPSASRPELDPVSARLQSLQLKAGERRGGGRRWGRLFGFVILVALGVAGYFGYQEYQRGTPLAALASKLAGRVGLEKYLKSDASQVPEIEAVAFGERSGGGVIVDVSGYIVPKKRISISPQVGGEIKVFPIEEGSKVKKGDVICQIEVDRYSAELNRAQAAVKSAQARLDGLKAGARKEEIEQAQSLVDTARAHYEHRLGEKEKMDRLLKDGAISPSEYQQFLATFKEVEANLHSAEAKMRLIILGSRPEEIVAAEADVEQAKASLEQTKFFFDNATILAPFDGIILEKNAQQGERIHPDVVIRNLCVLADMSDLEAEVEIQERDVPRVAIGHPCQVIPDAYPDRVYEAKLDRIQPQINKQRGVVPVKVKILKPDDLLLADMNCRVLFLRQGDEIKNQTPTVPERAIVRKEGIGHVYVFDGSAAKERRVEVGKKLGDEIEIVDGLKAGEYVLLPNKDRPVVDGQYVRIKLQEERSSGGSP